MPFVHFCEEFGDTAVNPLGEDLPQNIWFGDGAINIGDNYLLMMIPEEDLHVDLFLHSDSDIQLKFSIVFSIFEFHFSNFVGVWAFSILHNSFFWALELVEGWWFGLIIW